MILPYNTHMEVNGITKREAEIVYERLSLQIDNTSLKVAVVRRGGSLPPILFLHGFGSTKEDYADIIHHPSFTGRSFIAYDALGCGDTICEGLSKVSIQFEVKTALAVWEHLKIDQFHVAGHSMGGLTALILAYKIPSRILSVTNIKGNLENCFLSRQIVPHPPNDPEAFFLAFVERTRVPPYYSSAIYAASLPHQIRSGAVRAGRSVAEVMHDKQFEAINEGSSRSSATEDRELVALFAGLDAPAVSDALDKLGISGQVLDIMPLTNCEKVTVGSTFTVRYVPASDPPGSIGDFVDDVAVGDVVVIDNSGRVDCTVWGDIMTQHRGLQGIVGTVIDGVCRDVRRAIADDYPLFTTGRWMRTGMARVQVGGVNESIGIGKACIDPCDMVVADASGVVVVRRCRAHEVAAIARRIEESATGIRDMFDTGATIAEARERLGYYTLQRKDQR